MCSIHSKCPYCDIEIFNIEVDDFILSNNDKKDLKILQSLNPKQRKIASDFLSALQSGTISVED